jgi:hypothetical protein
VTGRWFSGTVLRFPPPIKLTAMILLLKVVLNSINQPTTCCKMQIVQQWRPTFHIIINVVSCFLCDSANGRTWEMFLLKKTQRGLVITYQPNLLFFLLLRHSAHLYGQWIPFTQIYSTDVARVPTVVSGAFYYRLDVWNQCKNPPHFGNNSQNNY